MPKKTGRPKKLRSILELRKQRPASKGIDRSRNSRDKTKKRARKRKNTLEEQFGHESFDSSDRNEDSLCNGRQFRIHKNSPAAPSRSKDQKRRLRSKSRKKRHWSKKRLHKENSFNIKKHDALIKVRNNSTEVQRIKKSFKVRSESRAKSRLKNVRRPFSPAKESLKALFDDSPVSKFSGKNSRGVKSNPKPLKNSFFLRKSRKVKPSSSSKISKFTQHLL